MDSQQESAKSLIWRYLEIAWRRRHCFIPFPFLLAVVFVYAMSLPHSYQSEGVLLVEQQNIPPELVRNTVTSFAAQQMEVIRQEVQATAIVSELIDRFGLYSELGASSSSSLVQRFRDNMQVNTVNANIVDPGSGRPRVVSIAFRISFSDQSPKMAQQVASELIRLFVEQNTQSRTKEAREASTFLRQEAEVLEKRVHDLEEQIAEFKEKNAGSLPELLEFNLGVITNSEERLSDVQVSIDNLIEQEQLLSIELRGMDPYTGAAIGSQAEGVGIGVSGGSLPARLAARRAELAQLSLRYSDSHPTIHAIKRDIATLERQISEEGAGTEEVIDEEDLYSSIYLNLRYRIGSIQRDIESMEAERERLRQQITDYNDRVAKTYTVEREYEDLQRNYLASTTRYAQLRDAQYEAEVAESLEENSQVEALRIIEEPRIPTAPMASERQKILLLGTGLSGVTCLGLALLLEFFDERVRGQRAFELTIGEAPLVAVPQISTFYDREERFVALKRKTLIWATAVPVGLLLLAGLVHYLVLDLRYLFGWAQ